MLRIRSLLCSASGHQHFFVTSIAPHQVLAPSASGRSRPGMLRIWLPAFLGIKLPAVLRLRLPALLVIISWHAPIQVTNVSWHACSVLGYQHFSASGCSASGYQHCLSLSLVMLRIKSWHAPRQVTCFLASGLGMLRIWLPALLVLMSWHLVSGLLAS